MAKDLENKTQEKEEPRRKSNILYIGKTACARSSKADTVTREYMKYIESGRRKRAYEIRGKRFIG